MHTAELKALIHRRWIFGVVFMCLCLNLQAQSTVSNNRDMKPGYWRQTLDKLSLGADLSARWQQQDFSASTTDLQTLVLLPYLSWEQWSLSADISWQNIEGEHFVNASYPRFSSLCDSLDGLTDRQLTLLAQRRENLQTTLDRCALLAGSSQESNISGPTDFSLFLSRGIELSRQSLWYTLLTVGYKADNGEWEDGLGTGTREITTEALLNFDNNQLGFTVLLGRQWIIGGELEQDFDDFFYAASSIGWHINHWFTLGGRADWQEAIASEFEDVSSVGAYVRLLPIDSVQLALTYTHYLDVENYPDHQVSLTTTFSF